MFRLLFLFKILRGMVSTLIFCNNQLLPITESTVKFMILSLTLKLKFQRVPSIHPIIEQAFKDGTVERDRIKLHHTVHCDRHEILITEHAVHLVYTPASGEYSILLTSKPPFDIWSPIKLPDQMKSFTVLGVAWDIQRTTVVLLVKDPFKVEALRVCRRDILKF